MVSGVTPMLIGDASLTIDPAKVGTIPSPPLSLDSRSPMSHLSLPLRPRATVFCEGNFAEIDGKTANGLVRQSERYEIVSVIDSTKAGRDAGEVLDGVANGIPVVADLAAALLPTRPDCFVVGVAPTSGLLSPAERAVILSAIGEGLDIINGLHEFLNDDIEFAAAAAVPLTSVRQPRRELGRAAARLLLDESDNPEHVHEQVEFLPELVARASTRRR